MRAQVRIPVTSPRQQYVGTGLATMSAAKRLASVAPEEDLGEKQPIRNITRRSIVRVVHQMAKSLGYEEK